MTTSITPEPPDTTDAQVLIAELEGELAPLYPSESRHGYSVEQLLAEAVAFFLIREDGVPAGCGGVKLVSAEYAEVKRMYVRPQFRGLGLARRCSTIWLTMPDITVSAYCVWKQAFISRLPSAYTRV